MFQPGQKVRLLHEQGEGVVIDVLSPTRYMVEIDEFPEEFEMDELVAISKEEEEFTAPKTFVDYGIKNEVKPISHFEFPVSVFEEIEDGNCRVHLQNDTKWTVLYAAFQRNKGKSSHIHHGVLPRGSKNIILECSNALIESLQALEFQIIRVHPDAGKEKHPIKEIRIPTRFKLKNQARGPYEGYEGDVLVLPLDNPKIEETSPTPSPIVEPEEEHFNPILDLHIENILDKSNHMTPYQIMDFQVSYFEKKLDKAILEGMESWIVIHGTGTGKLRRKIHEVLGQNPNVKSFKLASKIDFASGATEILFT